MAGKIAVPSGDWTTPHIPTWNRWLADRKGRGGVKALEIGVCAGGSSEWLLKNILTGEGSSLDCIDHWNEYVDEEAIFDARVAGLPCRKCKGYSEHVLPRLKVEGCRYSVIYVDGSHHAEHVLYDLCLCWSMLCLGGILIADDYTLTGRAMRLPPKPAIDGWLSCIGDSMQGYEISGGQIAVWKRL